MRKPSTSVLALILTLLWMAGCKSGAESPTKEQTVLPPNAGMNSRNYSTTPPDFTTPRSISPEVTPLNPDLNPVRTESLPGNIDWDHPPADLIVATVHFEFDQFNIEPDDRKVLEAAAKVIAADPTIRVVAIGHCDHFGSEQYNLALGDRRSNAVKATLARDGVSEAQVDVLSRGKFGAVPDVKKDSPEARQDRRVDVVKIPAGATPPSAPPPADATAAPATP